MKLRPAGNHVGRGVRRTARAAEALRRMQGSPEEEDRKVMSYSGPEIDMSEEHDVCRLDYRTALDFVRIKALPPRIVAPIFTFLREMVRSRSPETVSNVAQDLCHLFEFPGVAAMVTGTDDLDRALFEQMRREQSAETNIQHAGIRLGHYRRFYVFHADIYTPGFDADVANGLLATTLLGYRSGIAVASEDPGEGPLHRLEVKAVADGLLSIAACKLPLGKQAAAWLSLSFGSNPIALALLDERHFKAAQAPHLPSRLWLPSTKKGFRNRDRAGRWVDVLAPVDGLIAELIASNPQVDVDPGCARPLFRRVSPAENLLQTDFLADAYRHSPESLSKWLKDVANTLDLRSLNGDRLKLTPRRLRYTLIRRLVEEGATPDEVRTALDHTDDQTLLVYFEPGPDFLKPLDKAAAFKIAAVAAAFMGQVADVDAPPPDGETIVLPDVAARSMEAIGSCEAAACSHSPPVSCYKCRQFTAFAGGPHERALDGLLERRIRMQVEDADHRMITLHDREILAIADLLRRSVA